MLPRPAQEGLRARTAQVKLQARPAAAAATNGSVGARGRAFDERRDERARLAAHLAEQGVSNPAVLQAMREVPRHAFVAASWSREAYADRPLPIGHGQTISQPAVVASMTQAARPRREDKCLEIGTGSGYQAAVLAELCGQVFSIEYVVPLAKDAERAHGRAIRSVPRRRGAGSVKRRIAGELHSTVTVLDV